MIVFLFLVASASVLAWALGETREKRPRQIAAALSLALAVGAVLALPGGYLIQKVVGRLAMPVGVLWAVLMAAPFVAWVMRRRRFAAVIAVFGLVFTLAGNEYVAGRLLAGLEEPYFVAESHALEYGEPFDAVMVLGGGTGGAPYYYQLGLSGDRVMLGARLFHRGLAPRLITSGSSIPGLKNHHDAAEATSVIWRDLGIPDRAILRLPGPKNTSEEITELAELVRENGWTSVGLVTSAWHLRRAMRLAEKAGIADRLRAIPADVRGNASWDGFYTLIPSGYGFYQMHRACWEYLGAAVGR